MYRCFQDIERAGREHLECQPWFLSALRNANSGLVEDEVDATHHLVHDPLVTDVTVNDRYETIGAGDRYIIQVATSEIIEDNDLLASEDMAFPYEKIDYM